MYDANEPWKAEVNGEIYETTFGELTQWIAEGALISDDKVQRGELRWLQAGRVPPLRPFFEAKTNGTAPPVVSVTVADGEEDQNFVDSPSNPELPPEEVQEHFEDEFTQESHLQGQDEAQQYVSTEQDIDQSICSIHPETVAKFVCTTCAHGFCKDCPQSFGSNVKICPYCGAMCRSLDKMVSSRDSEARIQRDIAEGFGLGDFFVALGYPFKFGGTFLFGGLIVAALAYGQVAMGMGSFILAGFGVVCFVISTAFVFSMLSNTVNNFAKGEIDKNFLNFEDFDIWEDMLHPFFLYIGASLVSFGPLMVITALFAWHAISTITSAIENKPEETLTKMSQQSIDHAKQVREKLQAQNKARRNVVVGEDGLTDAQRRTLDEEVEFQKLNDLATNYKKAQLESTVGPSPEAEAAQQRALVNAMIKSAGVFLVLFFIFGIWAIFFFPAASAVAGYTRSFVATVNPAVGLDTIRHLGLDYVKILLMMFVLGIFTAVVGGVLAIILSPFNMPGVGNLPVTVLSGFVSFYSWIVFAVVLGLALYKNSDRLSLAR